jgi:hypothetical protein
MKTVVMFALLILSHSLFADVLKFDLKLSEVNPDSSQARFFKGEAAYGLSEIFASVTCWGNDGNRITLEIEKTGKEFYASFNSLNECKDMIKKAKGFMGINYGTIRFTINTQTKKVISFERI